MRIFRIFERKILPVAAKNRADDESADDLDDLDDSTVGGEIAGVERDVAHFQKFGRRS